MANIQKNDNVLVIAGKDRGKRGRVAKLLLKHDRLVVEGVNMGIKHVKPRPPMIAGGRLEQERPLHISNVMLICPKCNEPTRVGHRRLDDGTAVRICKHCGEPVK